jgi:hypothetical protein
MVEKKKNLAKNNKLGSVEKSSSESEKTKAEQTSDRLSKIPAKLTEKLKFGKMMQELQAKITEQSNVIKAFKFQFKKLESAYQYDITQALKSKMRRAGNATPTGFIKQVALPANMAKIIGVEPGTLMSMPKYTKEFYKELGNRDLFYDQDKRIFRADKEILKAFDLPESVNKSTDYKDINGFNFSTLQKYFSKVIRDNAQEVNKIEKKEVNKNEKKEVENDRNIKIKTQKKNPIIHSPSHN